MISGLKHAESIFVGKLQRVDSLDPKTNYFDGKVGFIKSLFNMCKRKGKANYSICVRKGLSV